MDSMCSAIDETNRRRPRGAVAGKVEGGGGRVVIFGNFSLFFVFYDSSSRSQIGVSMGKSTHMAINILNK